MEKKYLSLNDLVRVTINKKVLSLPLTHLELTEWLRKSLSENFDEETIEVSYPVTRISLNYIKLPHQHNTNVYYLNIFLYLSYVFNYKLDSDVYLDDKIDIKRLISRVIGTDVVKLSYFEILEVVSKIGESNEIEFSIEGLKKRQQNL